MRSFKYFTNLKKMVLPENSIKYEMINILCNNFKYLSNLTSINLSGNSFRDEGINEINSLKCIKNLSEISLKSIIIIID